MDHRKPFTAELQQKQRSSARPQPSGGLLSGSDRKWIADLASEAEAPAGVPTTVQVDNTEVLRKVDELSNKLDRFLNYDHVEIERIQVEIADISGRIKATKVEISQIRHPLANEDKFHEASEQLGAVVEATEVATNTIMSCAEYLEEIIQEVRAQLPDGYQSSRLNDMNELVVKIFEACNFQDLSGQRITKVVKTLSFIEERVNAMMSVWNTREFEAMPLPKSTLKQDGKLELHGPTSTSTKETISQADIDALFS